jgi:peptide/nickel transport system substrate-binding protein
MCFALPAAAKDTLTLDPTAAAPAAIREVTWGNIFEGLVTLDKDGKIQPLLVRNWTVSPGGLTDTFTPASWWPRSMAR